MRHRKLAERTLHRLWFALILAPLYLWFTPSSTPFVTSNSDQRSRPRRSQNNQSVTPVPPLWPTYSWRAWIDGQAQRSQGTDTKALIGSKLAIIGDTRASVGGLGPSARWHSQATWIKHDQPQALLHLGDWVKDGRDLNEWRHARVSLSLLEGLPILSVRGNHDRGGLYESQGFTDRPHHSLSVTQVGHFLLFLLDSEVETERAKRAVEALISWKRAAPERWHNILRRRDVKSVIWAQHRPIWSGGNHGNDERGWSSWLVPALEELGVQFCFAGHDHDYERFCESRGRLGERRCVTQGQESGVIYIISGGGASVTVPYPDLAWRARHTEIIENRAQRQTFSSAPHYIELVYTTTARINTEPTVHDILKLNVWSTPHEGSRDLLDQLVLPLGLQERRTLLKLSGANRD